ncbi:MAG: DnaB-like helicase C-terminal domain-containing protein [Acidimicrobiia bacterium]
MTIEAPSVGSGFASVRTANALFDDAIDAARGPALDRIATFSTKFQPLDDVLGGGFRAQELVLVGGRPGVGKTIAALQWARSMALQGRTALYVCYEHSPQVLLGRLFALELGSLVRADEVTALDKLRGLAQEVALGAGGIADLVADPLGEEALGRVRAYGDRLRLMQASGKATGMTEIDEIVRLHREGPTALFVDYVQKVNSGRPVEDEAVRTTWVVESLKDLAMTHEIAVVGIAASDKPAFEARRMRLHHLRGSAALAHECDVALIFNEKAVAVSKTHLAYDPVRAETFKRKVVITVEKNRGGPAAMDLEFTKDFGSYRFDPDGTFVTERLVDEVLIDE